MMITKQLLFMVSCVVPTLAYATDVGTGYFKNAGDGRMHVWVNGAYQGYVNPGETLYSVSDGFIDSHGGWENKSGATTITYQFGDGKMNSTEISGEGEEIRFTGTDDEGDDEELDLPSEDEMESAEKIIKGSKPNLKSSERRIEKDISSPYSEIAGDWDDNRSGGLPMLEIGGYMGASISIDGSGDVTVIDGNEVQKKTLKKGEKLWFGGPGNPYNLGTLFLYSSEKTAKFPNAGYRLSYEGGRDLFIVKVDGEVYASTNEPDTFIKPYKIRLIELTPRK